jgi:hypothetical protein
MSATFDFQALAARAPIDQPDAALHAGIEAMKDALRRYNRAKCMAERIALGRAYLAVEETLANRKPATIEGLLLKLRLAEKRMHKTAIHQLQAAASKGGSASGGSMPGWRWLRG